MQRTSTGGGERGPVPLHVLTGFLGSGKTTLLARLLERAEEPLAVLVNEVGALALDPWLVERVEEDVWALPSGCLCCELRGELYAALARLAAHRPARVVLETSGLTDPAPILHGLATDPRLGQIARPAGVVAVVDAPRAEDLLATWPEARRQLELADRVVLTKADLAPWREAPVRALLAEAAPGCEVRAALHGEVDPAWLLAPAALGGLRSAADARVWLHRPVAAEGGSGGAPAADGEGRAGGSAVRTIELPEPVELEPLCLWLALMAQVDGPRLLRIKLLARERASGEVFALQSAGRLVSPPRRLEVPPEGLEGLRGVLVARGLCSSELDLLVRSLASAARGEPLPAPPAR